MAEARSPKFHISPLRPILTPDTERSSYFYFELEPKVSCGTLLRYAQTDNPSFAESHDRPFGPDFCPQQRAAPSGAA